MAASSRSKTSSSTSKSRPSDRARGADRSDKSIEAFRDALERSVTLSRDRIQEVADDAVKRGRMTRDDANEMVAKLLARGRKQTEDLLRELERLIEGARGGVETSTSRARESARRVAKSARGRGGGDSGVPISGYDGLTVAEVKSRLDELDRPALRKVRNYERDHKARKGVIAAIDKKLG